MNNKFREKQQPDSSKTKSRQEDPEKSSQNPEKHDTEFEKWEDRSYSQMQTVYGPPPYFEDNTTDW